MRTMQLQRCFAACVSAGLVGCGGYTTSPLPGPPPQATPAGCVAGTETLTIVSGNGQTALPDSPLPEPAIARLTCESFANRGTTIPLVGAAVQWQAHAGGLVDGTSGTTKQTDNDGVTSVAWTLARAFSSQSLDAIHVTPRNLDRMVSFTAVTTTTTTTATSCQDAGGTDHGALTVAGADEAWTAAGSPHRGGVFRLVNDATLSIEAGAVICLTEIDGRVNAEGRSDAPIRFFGTSMPISPGLRHVLAEDVMKVGSVDNPALNIEDSTFRWTTARDPLACAQVAVSTATYGSVRRVLISGYGSQDCAALHISAYVDPDYYYYGPLPLRVEARIVDSVGDGVFIAGTVGMVSFSNCEVSSSGQNGITIPLPATAPGGTARVSATGCNLFGNGGDAIRNQSSLEVIASGNWWGDPAGPLGANGDGTSGDVDASAPSPAPLTINW